MFCTSCYDPTDGAGDLSHMRGTGWTRAKAILDWNAAVEQYLEGRTEAPEQPELESPCSRALELHSMSWAAESIEAETHNPGQGLLHLARIRTRIEEQFREALTAVLADAYSRVDSAINERSKE